MNQLFVEIKWLRNYIVANIPERLTSTVWKLKEVALKIAGFALEKGQNQILSKRQEAFKRASIPV